MVNRNSKIIHSHNVSTNNHYHNSIDSVSFVRFIGLVHKNLVKNFKKLVIPFSAVTTTFLFANINKAHAETNWIFQREGILTKLTKNETGEENGFIAVWKTIGEFIVKGIEWIIHLPENIAQLSANLLTKLYEILMLILQTPLFIFNNSYIKDTVLVFSSTSIFIVTILTVIELIKRMLNKRSTDFKDIVKRWSLAVVGSGFAPFLFEQTFNLLNIVAKAITQIGVAEMRSEDIVNYLKLSGFNTVLLLGFDIVLIAIMIPIFLQNGRRFFDLMCLSAITPLALASWVFDDYRHYFNKWWHSVKSLGSVQLVYSIFICIFGMFIFATRGVTDFEGTVLRLLIGIGALYRFANPPQFIKQKLDNGDDVVDIGKDMWKTAKGVWNTATFKPTRLFVQKKQTENAKSLLALRKKHGQRYVKGLK